MEIEYTLDKAIAKAVDRHKASNSLSVQIVTDFESRFFISTFQEIISETRFQSKPINAICMIAFGKIFKPEKTI